MRYLKISSFHDYHPFSFACFDRSTSASSILIPDDIPAPCADFLGRCSYVLPPSLTYLFNRIRVYTKKIRITFSTHRNNLKAYLLKSSYKSYLRKGNIKELFTGNFNFFTRRKIFYLSELESLCLSFLLFSKFSDRTPMKKSTDVVDILQKVTSYYGSRTTTNLFTPDSAPHISPFLPRI
jgi:hypothetical protein